MKQTLAGWVVLGTVVLGSACSGSVEQGSEGRGAAASAGSAGAADDTGGSGGADSGAGAASGTCSECGPLEQCYLGARCVAKLVDVPGGYAIDATEVTRSQYQAWLDSGPSPDQPTYCSWNLTFEPDVACMGGVYVCQGEGCGDHPQLCVDWCDAVAYCAASGKQLCGRIGGGTNDWEAYDDEALSQWYNACSSHGAHAYPYGDTYQEQVCAGPDHPVSGCAAACTTAEVGALSSCESSDAGFEGVYDMSGNAWEWVACCQALESAHDVCRIRGGSYGNGVTYTSDMGCEGSGKAYQARDTQSNSIGFRCCTL